MENEWCVTVAFCRRPMRWYRPAILKTPAPRRKCCSKQLWHPKAESHDENHDQGARLHSGARCSVSVDDRAQAERTFHLSVVVEPAFQWKSGDTLPQPVSGCHGR